MQEFKVDIVIFGGGIAGLWCLNTLRRAGYHAVLLESHQLGGGQTIHSQGMIHGGMKYALNGVFGNDASAIAKMSPLWQACVKGEGEIDLSRVAILSDKYYMWSNKNLAAKTSAFFASKLLRGRIAPLQKPQFPPFFQTELFQGNVYQLDDLVLDCYSLIEQLAHGQQNWIYKINPIDQLLTLNNAEQTRAQKQIIRHINLGQCTLKAKHYVFAAGEGNEKLLQQSRLPQPKMQRRPLHQVIVKHPSLGQLFAHCIGLSSKPRLTITSHKCANGQGIWYLGGALAETGVELDAEELIAKTQQELNSLFPWFDFADAQYKTVAINRAEPRQSNLQKPDCAFVTTEKDISTVWPTKLTLAPDLSQRLLRNLTKINLTKTAPTNAQALPLPAPTVAKPIWQELLP